MRGERKGPPGRGGKARRASRKALSKVALEAMIEEATVDCYNESEAITGWFTMIETNLPLPFETKVLGVPVRVERIALGDADEIVAVCVRDGKRQKLPILDLPFPKRRPEGSEWIDAYRYWLRGR